MSHVDWGVVAAFIAPLIAAMSILAGMAAWFVRIQIRLVTSVMEARLQAVEKAQVELQKTVGETAITVARIEGKISGTSSNPGTGLCLLPSCK